MKIRKAHLVLVAGIGMALVLMPNLASAQFLGHNYPGDTGLMSGTQAPLGWNLAGMYIRYDGATLRDRNGDSVALDPEESGSIDVNAYAIALTYVTEHKILGGTYGFTIVPAFTDNRFQAPIISINERVDTGLTDTYIQPITLGWNTKRADFNAGLGIYVPTGSYEAGADDNLGMGMWSFEISGGTTLYLDDAKSWTFATTAFYETHTKKDGTDIKVGDILTLEGGLGKSYMGGALSVGVAYYAQWKVTGDDPGNDLQPVFDEFFGKHRGFGVGPEVTIPIATKKKIIAFINARFLWETGIRSQLEGTTFTLAASFPIPSIPLQ